MHNAKDVGQLNKLMKETGGSWQGPSGKGSLVKRYEKWSTIKHEKKK